MLDLVEPFLTEVGVHYVRLILGTTDDGSMKSVDREAALKKIKSDVNTTVILISLKAGSTDNCFFFFSSRIPESNWAKDQAIDRSHRVGQTRPVSIYKLKIDNTVEDRILALQDRKRELARAALSGDKIKNMKLGMDDLLALFRPDADDGDD
ncbi:P-loop containing nucleoside triphosphate hydrolase protein [Mycena leptocephala]|nr:P-loop containing nucleoside triphosphate hydrolase protein [Mycena leptocephala]